MTDSPEDPFWMDLRRQATDADGYEPLSDADVERILAECGEEPLSDNEIESIVAVATKTGPRPVLDEADPVPPQRRHFFKAAGVLVGALSLTAGVIATVLYPEWWSREFERENVQHVRFVEQLVDQQLPIEVRQSAAGHVYGWLNTSISALQSARQEETLQAQAGLRIAELRALADAGNSDVLGSADLEDVRAIQKTIDQLVASLNDTSRSIQTRLKCIDELSPQIRLGILALKKVAAESESNMLTQTAAVLVARLRSKLL